ncbi:MAG TPA: hypothetical protein VJV39_16200 [Dongiaceae bacterium]|nr:hypothetical protein [Dongiaceae bacterium]
MSYNSVPWRDSREINAQVLAGYDEGNQGKILDFYSLHYFLYGALPSKNIDFSAPFEKAIVASEYGKSILSEIDDVESENGTNIAIALAKAFFHRDFLLDIEKSDAAVAMEFLDHELRLGTLRFAQQFDRILYDKFNDAPNHARADHLNPNEVDLLLEGTEQGVYQVGRYIVGPLGVAKSEDVRFTPPSISVPLWHCADLGCQALHSVDLLRHANDAYYIAGLVKEAAEGLEGPESEWEGPISRIRRTSTGIRGREYFDIVALIADTMSNDDKEQLVLAALKGKRGDLLRSKIRTVKGDRFVKAPPERIAEKLSNSSKLQLLLLLPDKELVELIDRSVLEGRVKIPPTETRAARSTPPTLSSYDPTSTLSALGIRSDREDPILFLSSIVWAEYEHADQLTELAWRCQTGAAMPKPEEPIAYMHNHTPREAVRNLILPSRPIALAIANRLNMELLPLEPEDQLIDRFLWKFGFKVAQYDPKYDRFRAQLQKFREELISSPPKLNDDDRDSIRSRGVNVFVSLENFIEELISFSVWLLASDHFGGTHFEYKSSSATSAVAAQFGDSITIGGTPFNWKSEGGNVLSTLLVYGRRAADWMLSLSETDKAPLRKPSQHIPHFVDDNTRQFPFLHRELWADAVRSELQKYAEQFNSIFEQLERSHLAEVRNGLDHYREKDKFPSIDIMIACENRITAALDSADLNRFVPKAYWMTEFHTDEFGISEYVLQDYRSRKLVLRAPAIFSGLKGPTFSRPVILPYGNLLGSTNSDIVVRLVEESSYTSMWENYPRRREGVREEVAASASAGQ